MNKVPTSVQVSAKYNRVGELWCQVGAGVGHVRHYSHSDRDSATLVYFDVLVGAYYLHISIVLTCSS